MVFCERAILSIEYDAEGVDDIKVEGDRCGRGSLRQIRPYPKVQLGAGVGRTTRIDISRPGLGVEDCETLTKVG